DRFEAHVTIRFLADEDIDVDIVQGPRAREPAIDILDVKSAGLAEQNRIHPACSSVPIGRAIGHTIVPHCQLPQRGPFRQPGKPGSTPSFGDSLCNMMVTNPWRLMHRRPLAIARLLVLGSIAGPWMRTAEITNSDLERRFTQTVRPFLTSYCVGCHSGASAAAQLDLRSYSTMAA